MIDELTKELYEMVEEFRTGGIPTMCTREKIQYALARYGVEASTDTKVSEEAHKVLLKIFNNKYLLREIGHAE